MSKLEKLTIQGIRSFNPKEKNVIEFFTPLTLIVGSNGTGKTTIIECLKYITTGDMPPNSRGGAFIYDPKIAKEIDIKAEVKLRFINNRNEVLICNRSMQSSMRKAKSEQKTLECTLSKEIKGDEVLMTSKLADIDRYIPEHLGVSYSILENVIFCHQDESIWPISDPTIMKKKLDDIFSSTKYNKALLGLKSSKKEISSDLKLKTQQLSFYLKDKLKRDEILKKIQEQNEEIEKKNTKLRIIKDEIQRIEDNIKSIGNELVIYEKLEHNYKILKGELDNCTKFIGGFSYEILNNFNKENAIETIKEIEESLILLNNSNIEEEYSRIDKYRTKVLEESNKNDEILNKIKNLEKSVEELLKDKQGKISSLMTEFECNEDELKLKIPEVFQLVENNIKSKEIELNNDKEILILQKNTNKQYEKTLLEKRAFIERYKDLKERSNVDLKEINIDYDPQLELEATVDELLEEINIKQDRLNEAFKQSEKIYKRNLIKENIDKLKNELKDQDLLKINQSLIKTYNKELEILKMKYNEINVENQRNSVVYEHNKALNRKIMVEIKVLEEKLGNDDNNIEEIKDVNAIKSEIEVSKSKIENNKYASAIYKNFLELGNKNETCPLCKTQMKNEILKNFKERLETFLEKLPERVKTTENKLIQLKKSYEIAEIQNKEILERNNIKNKIKQLSSELISNDIKLFDLKELENEIKEKKIAIEELLSLQAKKDELILLENELLEVPNVVDVTPLKNDLNNTKKLLEEKRSELSKVVKEIKDKERLIKEIEEEKENRVNIKIRDGYKEDIKSIITYNNIEEQEKSISNKEDKLNKIKQRYMKRKIDVENNNSRILAIDKRVIEIKGEIERLRRGITDQYKNDKILFNGKEISVLILKDTKEYEKIRMEIIGYKNRIIKNTKDLEIAKYNLLVIEENIKLKKTKERMIMIEEELKSYKMGEYSQLKNRQMTYEEKRIKMGNNESLIKGELKQIIQTIKSLQEECEAYKNANKNYLSCALEIKALELSLEDLDKCINALDKAIVDFHSSKIEEVNKTLRDLWGVTYKGNDIDYVELKSESSETRAYNYRMVMVKNGIELDMRGRSSAGQKMVASILFRIALAESFSFGCNVLALDEPTTNLDKENIESLAQTLSVIIKERTDFQLIIITHDEEFVQLLNREGTEYYYRIKRDIKGNSNIVKHSIYE